MKNKQIPKRMAAGILTGIVAITGIFSAGCGGAGSNNDGIKDHATETGENLPADSGAKGRYIETLVELPEEVEQINQLLWRTDGSLVAIDNKNCGIFRSTDNGASFLQEEIPGFTDVVLNGQGDNVEVYTVSMAPDGSVFYAYVDWTKAEGSQEAGEEVMQDAVLVSPEGAVTELDAIPYSNAVMDSVYLENGMLYTLDMGGNIYLYDTKSGTTDIQSKTVMNLEGTGNYRIAACGEGILATDGAKAYYYDDKVGQPDDTDEVFGGFLAKELAKAPESIAFAFAKEKICTASANGLYSHVKGGSTMEELMPGEFSCMGDPSMQITAMTAKEDGTFLIAYDNGEIYSYQYDPNVSSVPEEILQVYGLYDNTTLRKAISKFRKDYPNVYVKFEIGITGEDSITASDAIQTLNTRLLAGEGPDIILLDGMPMDSYIEKGMLEDLSPMVKEMKQESSYYENILEVYQSKGGLYSLPIRFYIPAVVADEENLNGVQDLKSLADTVSDLREANTKEGTILNTFTPEELLSTLYLTSSPAFTQDGKLQEEKIREFLTEGKRIYEAEQKYLTEEQKDNHMRMLKYWQKSGLNEEKERLSLDIKIIDLFINAFLCGGYLTGMNDLQYVSSIKEKITTVQYQVLPGLSEQVFTPNGIVGMNAKSKEKENAMAFLKALFGKEVQGVDLEDGFPVNQDAYETYCSKLDESIYSFSAMDGEGNGFSLEVVWPPEQEIQNIKDIIASLKVPTQTDAVLKDTILSFGATALTGEKSIEDCVNEIKQKISIYMEE